MTPKEKAKCVKCGSDAEVLVGGGLDPDIQGIFSCNEHKEAVRTALLMAVTEKGMTFEKALNKIK